MEELYDINDRAWHMLNVAHVPVAWSRSYNSLISEKAHVAFMHDEISGVSVMNTNRMV